MVEHFPREIESQPVARQQLFPEQSASMTVFEELNEAARTFVGPIFILLPDYYRFPGTPHLHIDLSRAGLLRGSQYHVYHEGNRLLYTSDQRYFGANLRDQRLVAASPHGTCLFVQFSDGRKLNRVLIWICKRRDHPQLASSLRSKKSVGERLRDTQTWQPLKKARDRVVQMSKLNEVLRIEGHIKPTSGSRVCLSLEPILVLQGQTELHHSGRSQVVATGSGACMGTLQAVSRGQSHCQSQGCTLVVGQLRARQASSSKLESHFRVCPRDPSAPEMDYIYGAFGRALLKHRDRYWFSFDPILAGIPMLPDA